MKNSITIKLALLMVILAFLLGAAGAYGLMLVKGTGLQSKANNHYCEAAGNMYAELANMTPNEYDPNRWQALALIRQRLEYECGSQIYWPVYMPEEAPQN